MEEDGSLVVKSVCEGDRNFEQGFESLIEIFADPFGLEDEPKTTTVQRLLGRGSTS